MQGAALQTPPDDLKRLHSQFLEAAAHLATPVQRRHIKVQRLLYSLSQGLSQFFGDRTITTKYNPRFRVAAVLRATPDEPIYVYDPNDLLADTGLDLPTAIEAAETDIAAHSTTARKPYVPFFIEEWYITVPDVCGLVLASESVPLVGIIVESPRGLKSQDAVKEWIAAVGRIACERLHSEIFSFPDTASMAMRSYAMESVVGALQSQVNEVAGNSIKAQSVVEAFCELSVQAEEGERPTGTIVIVQKEDLDSLDWQMEFPDDQRPKLEETTLVAKLFALCEGTSALISDGAEVYGIADIGAPPQDAISATFSNGRASITFNGVALAVVSNGALHAPFSPPEHILRDTLHDLPHQVTEDCIRNLMSLVGQARRRGYGSTLVIHKEKLPDKISGSELKHPLPVNQLTARMCAVDGAVILDSALYVRAFGCLLDGMIESEENRARGSRYNSAQRYTRLHRDAVVVVVSSDGPVSVFVNGEDLTVVPPLVDKPTTVDPPTLDQFVEQQYERCGRE